MIQSFAPIVRADARILILGSMPGAESLRLQQYYAHPRNAFWPIMASLLGFDACAPYPERVRALQDGGVAVWDVLARCERVGSLDSRIERDSAELNDLPGLIRSCPALHTIGCNGQLAFATFQRHVQLRFQGNAPAAISGSGDPAASRPAPLPNDLRVLRLPSTSPANAGLNLESKRAQWQAALLAN